MHRQARTSCAAMENTGIVSQQVSKGVTTREAVKVRASKKEEIELEIAALRRQLEAERDSV
eukprot:889781-Amphidinium_carterae.1